MIKINFLARWLSSKPHPTPDSETQLHQQIQALLDPYESVLPERDGKYSVNALRYLTHSYNGYVREKAVMALALKRDISALPELIACINDWVPAIHIAATTEVIALMTPDNVPAFIHHLAQIRQLRVRQRYDHCEFINQLSQFLVMDKNLALLKNALYSSEYAVREAAMITLIEQQQLNDETEMSSVLANPDTHLRSLAVDGWLQQHLPLTATVVTQLLTDCSPRIRRKVLFYLDETGQALPAEIHLVLLLDKNSFIRQRACRMLAGVLDAPRFWLEVINSPGFSPTQRCSALYGLKDLRYPQIQALAESGYRDNEIKIRKASLHILVMLKGENARDKVLETLRDPVFSSARGAYTLIIGHAIYLSRDELQQLLNESPSTEHTLLYWRLARRQNKWDWLLLLLNNYPALTSQQRDEQRCIWIAKFNLAAIPPNAYQREQLAVLLPTVPELHNAIKSYLL